MQNEVGVSEVRQTLQKVQFFLFFMKKRTQLIPVYLKHIHKQVRYCRENMIRNTKSKVNKTVIDFRWVAMRESHPNIQTRIYIYIYIYMCVCVCVCVLKGIDPLRDSYFLQNYFFVSYIRVCFLVVAFVREHTLHTPL